jgi:hypothetical protein
MREVPGLSHTHLLKGWYLVKKLIAVLLCLAFATALTVGVVGCGDKKDDKKTPPTATSPTKST